MTAEDLLNAYRDEMAPTLGRAFIEGFIARNRSSLLRMLAPLVALMNERMQAPRVSEARREEDPDAVTPEKDAIVWAAFMDLVNQKRRAFGMQELELTESMPLPHGPIAITLRHPRRRDLIAMVTASASEPGRYQLTWADDEGPSGHTTRDTAEEAVRYALEEGYRLDTANSNAAREMVERVQKAREQREAEIESWLHPNEITESMSVFGRREPDRKEIVEFIQEIKETRKSDWRLAEVLAMHFEVPETKIVEWLNEHNVCPGATTRTMASKCDPSRYKAPKKAEGWLSRKFSGRPKREDLLKVIRELKRERRGDWMLAPTLAGSFGVPDATIVEWLRYHDICPRVTTRSMASQCVIEDVESLPSRGSCGRTSKERRQAEHIAESYESRGVDPRTSKSRACATVNARRNEQMESLPAPGDFNPRDWSAQHVIASTMRWEPHDHLYYELLSVRPDATESEIYRAWRLAQTEVNDQSRPMKLQERMQFMLRKQAYDVLSNKEWRKDYDQNGNLDASFRGLRRRVAEATAMVSSGDALSEGSRGVLLAVNDMGPEAYAAHSGRSLPELVELLKRTLHEVEADDAKYRLPSKTESLPLPKHAGRMGDGFTVGEHVIRIGDMIKMEGQLGGYVVGVDRDLGIAKIEQDNAEIKMWPLASLLHDTKANRQRQQDHNDKINAEAEARLELSLADWRAR